MNIPLDLIFKHATDIRAVRAAQPNAFVLVAANTPSFRLIGESGAVRLEDFERGYQNELRSSSREETPALRRRTILGRVMFIDRDEAIVAFEVEDNDLVSRVENRTTHQQRHSSVQNELTVTNDGTPVEPPELRVKLEYTADFVSAQLQAREANGELLLDAYLEIDSETTRPALYLRFKDNLEREPSAAYWLDSGEIKQ